MELFNLTCQNWQPSELWYSACYVPSSFIVCRDFSLSLLKIEEDPLIYTEEDKTRVFSSASSSNALWGLKLKNNATSQTERVQPKVITMFFTIIKHSRICFAWVTTEDQEARILYILKKQKTQLLFAVPLSEE